GGGDGRAGDVGSERHVPPHLSGSQVKGNKFVSLSHGPTKLGQCIMFRRGDHDQPVGPVDVNPVLVVVQLGTAIFVDSVMIEFADSGNLPWDLACLVTVVVVEDVGVGPVEDAAVARFHDDRVD